MTLNVRAPLSPTARLRFDVLRRYLAEIPDGSSLLEIGAGQGALATILARRFDYVAYEPDEASAEVARLRLERIGRGKVIKDYLPAQPDRQFDVVAAFEVLEHMADDAETLRSWVKWIRPGGHLLLSVPADPRRFGPSDTYAGHYRRYTRKALLALLEGSGLSDAEIGTYGLPLGYFLEASRNRIARRKLEGVEASPEELTVGSGGRLQVDSRLSPLVWAATYPFAVVQRPFQGGNRGIGFVVHARKSQTAPPA